MRGWYARLINEADVRVAKLRRPRSDETRETAPAYM
jgi:hypothetical protein